MRNTKGKFYVREVTVGGYRYWNGSAYEWTMLTDAATFYTDRQDAERAHTEAEKTTTAETEVCKAVL